MFKFAIVLCIVSPRVLGAPSSIPDLYIVGGTKAEPGMFPFAVSISNRFSNDFSCGGALVSEQFVLTAAHCLFDPLDMAIGVGSVELSKQMAYEVEKTFPHPLYNPPKERNHDIALIKLHIPVELSPTVQLIEFPYPKNAEKKNVTAMGWGKIRYGGPHSETLLYLEKPTLTNAECQRFTPPNGVKIGEGQICIDSTKNFGMCNGDSGSPLLLREDNKNYIVGVVSRGIPCALGYPDIFSRVSYYSDWLKKTIAENS